MKDNIGRATLMVALVALIPAVDVEFAAGANAIQGYVIASGGGISSTSSGTFVLSGTVGEDFVGSANSPTFSIQGGFLGGAQALVSAVEEDPAPSPHYIPPGFSLYASRPNPFGISTVIPYDVPAQGGTLQLAIYDVVGRRIRILVEGEQVPGRRTAVWDGRDGDGQRIGPGVYLYSLIAPGYQSRRKLIVVK